MAKDSACLPDYTSIGIHSNHTNMAKFAKNDDLGAVAVFQQLRRWLGVRRPATPLPAERRTVVSQHGHGNRQYTCFGGGKMKIAGGNFFEVRGNHNDPMNDVPVHPPPPYSD